jgi:hypothetical protein
MLLILLQLTCFESGGLFSRVPYLDSHPGFKACGRFATGNLHAVKPRNRVNTKTRKANNLVHGMSGETQDYDKENTLCWTKDYDKLFNNRRTAKA